MDALAAHLAEHPATAVEIIDITGAKPVTREAQLIFTTADGLGIRRTFYSAGVLRPAVAAARNELTKDWEKITPTKVQLQRALAERLDGATYHDLRHFYASLLIRHGESVKTVQSRLGHASARETLDTYSHLWPDSDDRTREAVDLVLGEAATAAES